MATESPHCCAACGRDVSNEALATASIEQYSGFNPMSIQYAQAWSDEQLAGFLRTYVCEACRTAARTNT